MKLQKKKLTNIKVLGEIVSCDEYGCIAVKTEQGVVWYYRSLAELNEEWEDYEEPKTFFTIYYDGMISEFKSGDDEQIRDMKEIGNYFGTREEAELAVRKLKAWKRLKDYNVKFNLDFVKNKIYFNYTINNPLLDVLDGKEQIFNNMKIVFGIEE